MSLLQFHAVHAVHSALSFFIDLAEYAVSSVLCCVCLPAAYAYIARNVLKSHKGSAGAFGSIPK